MSEVPRAFTGGDPIGVTKPDDWTATGVASSDAVDEALKTRTIDEAPVGITVADATTPNMPLVYVNTTFERITGYPSTYAVGRNCRFLQGEATRDEPVARMRAAIEAGEATSVELRNYTRDGDPFWNEVTLSPLRDATGEVAYYVGFQQDVTRRKHAERAAARRAARIESEQATQEHLLDRLDGVVGDVTAAVSRARSHGDLVCGVVSSLESTYAGAWYGEYDPAADVVVPAAKAGTTAGDVPARTFPVGDGGDDPVATAVSGALDDRRVRIESLATATGEVNVVAAVPLWYGDVQYGVFCVYSRDCSVFAEHERDVLTALGRTVATGTNALESQRTLRADEAVELRFGLFDEHPLTELAARLDCRVRYTGSVGDRDQPADLLELTGCEVDGEAVRRAVTGLDVDVLAVLVDGADGCLVELSVADPGLRGLLAEHGAELRAATFDRSTGQFTVNVARESLARSLAEAVTERFESADLLGFRRQDRRTETQREFLATLEADLTERQHAALVRAYTGGYFEWPHEATGDDIASAMGVCRSTFHQHLRAAERKLVGALVDRGFGADAGAVTDGEASPN
ncbi:bacterio-opsin activator domain-containing protein [Haloplanus pelagicus]|jgi:PAS domain S-box-containing protein|uniref:bacterio-opsin activator domain-containing protein n=1 Tax=Haloplanus pelagicus TaxID=2949995 RepID=UPI0020425F35|nr:bacterio-opsin activator domain-containing protein [Haloplanus sp. HW8-1]